jgi:cell division protein FtsB
MKVRFSRISRQRLRVIGAGTALLLTLWLLFSPFGLLRYLRVQIRLAAVKQEVLKVEQENRALESKNELLLHDLDYLEEVARKKYGLVKENEIVFEFNKDRR